MQISDLGEFTLIERLLVQIRGGAGVALGPGDDAAAVAPSAGMLLLATCDSQVEGRHFRRDHGTPVQLGRRLAAVNLSDIAAMGGLPKWSLVSLCLPATVETAFVEDLYQGLTDELGKFGASLVGGNLAGADQLVLDLTMLGEIAPAELLRRSGARPGDAILVTGSLGASAAGRAALESGLTDPPGIDLVIAAHLTPQARVSAGRAIAESGLATAMIDVSDGLVQDIGHICDASNCGMRIVAPSIPISDETRTVADLLGADPLQWALGGGEDYELVLTAASPDVDALCQAVARDANITLSRIGTVLPADGGRWLEDEHGNQIPLVNTGWEHFGPGIAHET